MLSRLLWPLFMLLAFVLLATLLTAVAAFALMNAALPKLFGWMLIAVGVALVIVGVASILAA
jgi:NADH:ubiquinone oxidoreductase subunit K